MYDRTDYSTVPEQLLDGLTMYGQHRIRTGGFLQSVLENDLEGAIGRAHPESLRSLGEIVRFIHNEMPDACYGSPEIVQAWINGD